MLDFKSFQNRQRYMFLALLVCLAILGCLFWVISRKDISPQPRQILKSSLATGASRINPQEAWVYEFRQEAELAKKRLGALEEMLNHLLKLNEKSQNSETQHSSTPQMSSSRPEAVSESVATLRHELKEASTAQTLPNPAGQVLPALPPNTPETTSQEVPSSLKEPSGAMNPQHFFRSKSVRKISLSLKNARSTTPLKTVDNTVPAGAFAKAILLGGVDASASIQASSDPRPALLRLMDAGTLPRKFHADLKGCHILAACYGDISSERVFMRLEKLTCTERKTGEIVEVKVQGYVAGEDGRTGVRGTVVDRAGTSMRNAMMGGFLSGLGEFFGQSRSTLTFSPMAGLAQSNPLALGDMLKSGAGKGINSALDKYADFYIKRAEQVQPVIQVAAGRQVDIVFTEGVSVGDSVYRQVLGHANDQERYHQLQGVQDKPQAPINDWIPSQSPNNSGGNQP